MEERLRHLERVLAKGPRRAPASASGGPARWRIDAAHPTGRCRSTPAWNLRRKNSVASWAWRLGQAILAIGLAASACGGSLVAWSAYSARPELWSVGIPIAIAGQIAMLIALAVRSAGSAPAEPAAGAEARPYTRIPGLRIDREGHVPEVAPSQALLDLVARLEELSKKLDRQAD